MLVFPQLLSGATTQFPNIRRVLKRNVVNAVQDGSTIRLADPGWSMVEWELAFAGLTSQERSALESLFEAAEGRLRPFLFLDPTDNLITSSEDLSAEAWLKDPLLQLTPNIQDPLGTLRATRIANPSQGALALAQELAVPSLLQFCFSAFVRSGVGADAWLFRRSAAGAERQQFRATPEWKRVEHLSAPSGGEEPVTFGVEVAAGQTLDVFGFQLEVQPAASQYKKTYGVGGVYPDACFQEDVLSITANGVEDHSCTVRIRARLQG